jgi:mono/diheme cytochrome c family protein
MHQKLYHWGMHMRSSVFAAAGLIVAVSLAVSAGAAATTTTSGATTSQAPPRGGWVLPPTADEEKNPFAADPKAVAAGKELYGKKCQRCHGPGGKGDGPDADPDIMEDMDLTNPKRAARNADGIVFYKAWNGRTKPKMPAVKDELSRDQLWQIVTYVQTLRQKS